MAYSVTNASIMELSAWGLMNSQRILLVRHYVLDYMAGGTLPDAGSVLGDLLNYMDSADSWMNSYAAATCSALKFDSIRAQWIWPFRYAYVQTSSSFNPEGQLPDVPLPQNEAVCITLQADETGKAARGSAHICGVSSTAVENGLVTAGALPLYDSLKDGLVSQIADHPVGVKFNPILYHKADPSLSYFITHGKVELAARTMARRTVGRGI